MEDIKFICLLPEKDIKTLKPSESEDMICFYSTIEECLTNQCLYNNPGIYYVYKPNDFKFDCLSFPYKAKISFSKEISVICIAKIDFLESKPNCYFKNLSPSTSCYEYKYTIKDLQNDKNENINSLTDSYQFRKLHENMPYYNMNCGNGGYYHQNPTNPFDVPIGRYIYNYYD